VDAGIFAVEGGIFATWFAEVGRWFLFGNDDAVERSLGRGMARCSSMVALKLELQWSESRG
jgi:hypothetical protein